MSTSKEHFDVIIIGSGAGGGTISYALAPSKKRILILERGDFLPREEDNWSTKAVFTDSKYKAKEEWLDKNGKPFHPGIHYFVGGNTKVYGAVMFRFRERDFQEIIHMDGLSPSWPISYDDLEAYYTKAEELYLVHGERNTDPTEPPTTAPYPHPALPHEPRIQKLYDDLKRIGQKPFPLPVGVRLNEDSTKPHAQIVLSHFDGYPDPTHSKADAEVCGVNLALEYENVTLKTNHTVTRLKTDESGKKITEVHANIKTGGAVVFSADTVILAAGAINSAALLLRNKSEKYPNGLANTSGMVGRHYMAHNNSALVAISKEPNNTLFGKTIGINDFYFGSDDWDYPLGHIQMLGKSDAELFKAEAPSVTPGIALEKIADHAIDFWLTTEDLPDPENRVTIDENGKLVLTYTENNLEAHKRLTEKLKGMLDSLGCEKHLISRSIYLGKKIPIAGTAHQCGTLRFGNDPEKSVLDRNCKSHDIDNLYVVDSSFFPSSTSVNPSLTIIANALRVGEHLLKNT